MVRYVALGDSYSIGTGVEPDEAWPRQLASRLADLDLDLIANLGVNGSTADDVATEQMPELEALQPELASLLVGVNDVVQGGSRGALWRASVRDPGRPAAAAAAVPPVRGGHAGLHGQPPGQRVRGAGAAAGRRAAQQRDPARRLRVPRIAYVPDTFDISQQTSGSEGMLAPDGLHPSAAQYSLWVDAIEPSVRAMLALPSDDR